MNLENSLKKASQILKDHNIYSHELDAQIILSDIMGIKREFLITNNEINISEKLRKNMMLQLNEELKKKKKDRRKEKVKLAPEIDLKE